MSIVKNVVGAVTGTIGGLVGGVKGPTAPSAPEGPNPWDEYQSRLDAMKATKAQDLSSMRARMASSGMKSDSTGWMQGLQSIEDSYSKKLADMQSDPYFSQVADKAKAFGWGSDDSTSPSTMPETGSSDRNAFFDKMKKSPFGGILGLASGTNWWS